MYYWMIDEELSQKPKEYFNKMLEILRKNYGKEYQPSDLETQHIMNLLNTHILVPPDSIWDYYRSASGRFAIAKRGKGEREEGIKLRLMLKRLATLTVEKIRSKVDMEQIR